MVNAPILTLMVQSPSTEPPVHSTATSTRLLESGVELLRAELAVVLARASGAMTRAVAALLATILAAALLQVALVVGVLSPFLARSLPAVSLWIAIALPVLLALASTIAAVLAWRSMARSLNNESAPYGTAGISRAADTRGTGPMLVSLQEERL
jgi:hypothetical protein